MRSPIPSPVAVFIAAVLIASLITSVVSANPPRPGTEANGLTENESATLWSRDADAYITQAEYQQRYGDTRTVTHQLANGTDITFKRPPATAATWTRNDFTDLNAGGPETSVYPPHAALHDGEFIKDAHATIFAVQPSTHGHLESGVTPHYIAPNGTLRGFVDYRVRVPNESDTAETTENTSWSLVAHEIEEIRLQKDGETIAKTSGIHTPVLDYQISDDWNATLTLEADIHVRLRQTVRTGAGTQSARTVSYHTETHTVSDSIAVKIYDLSASPYYATFPNGDAGVAIFQTQPWQGYTLTDETDARVRGIWRFYTARDSNWDTLVSANQTASTEYESDAIPVYVHAYPSRIGPRAEPVRDGPDILETWGIKRGTPTGTIDENVDIEVVNQSYTTTYGVAVRSQTLDREALRVAGIVRGVNASIVEPPSGSERQLRESTLTADVLWQNQSQALVEVQLRDSQTGDPIVLANESRWSPIGGDAREGYITIGEKRVETNAFGIALVTLDDPDIYTARYYPGSWLGQNPAYVSDTATVRWHPLGTIDGWFAFLFESFWQLIPFFVMFYAGHRLLRMLGPEDLFQQDQ